MKKLQRYTVTTECYGGYTGMEECVYGDFVRDEDVEDLEERAVRLKAERDTLFSYARDAYNDDVLDPVTKEAGDDAVTKWKEANR